MNWINNDTIALGFLGVVALCGVFVGMEQIVIAGLSAIGGYIGSKGVQAVENKSENIK